MLLSIAKRLVSRKLLVPESYQRMVRTEFKSVKLEYVELFYQQNNRLPTMQELQDAI